MPPLAERVWLSLKSIPHAALAEGTWYFLLAGGAWLGFYVLFRRLARRRKISPRDPTFKQIGWETLFSVRSLVVFGIVGGLMAFLVRSGASQMYFRVEDRGWPWFAGSVVLMIFLHDAYFYWTHRLMHHRRLFRRLHAVHHRSTSPTPWAAYSFSVGEAVVQAMIGPLIVVVMPAHPAAFGLFMTWQIAFNVLGHSGHEVFPRWFLRSWLGRFANTPTHHALHHESFRANYGLYFNFWDRLMGTNHPHYEERFHEVTSGRAAAVRLGSEAS
jgi:sterol desaturase/sphingolipid hydroxylase (fatty acid hydroxylase superfamily)